MANPLGIFFSRLAPEDKNFIKRIGIILIIVLIASGAVLFFFSHFGKNAMEKTASSATAAEQDTLAFELPPSPEIPETLEEHVFQTVSQPSSDFDEQAHLQLMRQNASKYNYKMAYRHGARIESYLLANPEFCAEWGRILLEAGNPAEAVLVLQKITFGDSVKSEVAANMAFALLRSGKADEALEFLDDLAKNSNDLNLTTAKATVIAEHPDTTKRSAADSVFKIALKSKPPLPEANYQYGRFLMQRGDYQNSKIYLERALKANPHESRYIARLGMAEYYLKRDLEAETLYKRALKINPYDYNTWFNLGELYLSEANESGYIPEIRKKTQDALGAYLKAIENDSLHAKAHYRIGIILNVNGEHKEAIGHLTTALEKTPGDISVMRQLGSAYMQLGDTAKYINYLGEILRIDPFDRIASSEFRRLGGNK